LACWAARAASHSAKPSRAFKPAHSVSPNQIVSFLEFPAFILLGLVSALMAIVFMHAVAFIEQTVQKTSIPLWARPACGGLLVGIIALAFPQVLGVGYEATNDALHEQFQLWLLISLLVAKTAATAISLGFGFGAGVFSPSLFLGAMLGGAFGIIATHTLLGIRRLHDRWHGGRRRRGAGRPDFHDTSRV